MDRQLTTPGAARLGSTPEPDDMGCEETSQESCGCLL